MNGWKELISWGKRATAVIAIVAFLTLFYNSVSSNVKDDIYAEADLRYALKKDVEDIKESQKETRADIGWIKKYLIEN